MIDAAALRVDSSSEGGGSDDQPPGRVPRCPIALSFIAPEHGEVEDQLAAAGIKVFSISPHARFDPLRPLAMLSPERNASSTDWRREGGSKPPEGARPTTAT